MEFTESAEAKMHCYGPRITVLGIGNLLLKDEGVGIHLVQQLEDKINSENINIVDSGTLPDILSLIDDNVDKLIIVDAVKAGNEPGTIYRLNLDELDSNSTAPISLHEIGVVDSLRMMALLHREPGSTVIIGIEPKTIDYGLELSPEVERNLPEVTTLIFEEIDRTNKEIWR